MFVPHWARLRRRHAAGGTDIDRITVFGRRTDRFARKIHLLPWRKKSWPPKLFSRSAMCRIRSSPPDGSQVAFVVSDAITGDKRTRHIWLYDKKIGAARQITFSEKSESSPRWSPNGKMLAFLSNRDEEQQIYILRIEGGEGAALTKGKAGVHSFGWSPDGQSIAFISPDPPSEEEEKKKKDKDDAHVVDREDKNARLRVVNVSTEEARALTPPTWGVRELDWLPDGQSIVVNGYRPARVRPAHRAYLRGRRKRRQNSRTARSPRPFRRSARFSRGRSALFRRQSRRWAGTARPARHRVTRRRGEKFDRRKPRSRSG